MMRQKITIGLLTLLLSGCFWGDGDHVERKLTKDFYLNWFDDTTNQEIILSDDGSETNGRILIKETVFAVGFDDNFIIAKQHPNKEEEISDRLFHNYDTIVGAYLFSNPADTIFIWSEDSIFKKNEKWYHISNGWNPPDTLKPWKRQTFYHIIDIRNYKRKTWIGVNIFNDTNDKYKIYTFNNQRDFKYKCNDLGVAKDLTFTIKNITLE